MSAARPSPHAWDVRWGDLRTVVCRRLVDATAAPGHEGWSTGKKQESCQAYPNGTTLESLGRIAGGSVGVE